MKIYLKLYCIFNGIEFNQFTQKFYCLSSNLKVSQAAREKCLLIKLHDAVFITVKLAVYECYNNL